MIVMSHSSILSDILTVQLSLYISLDQTRRISLYIDLETHSFNQTAAIEFIKIVLQTSLNLTSCFPLTNIFKKAAKNIFSLHLHSFYLSYVTYRDVMKNHHLFMCKLKKHALATYSKSSRCHLQLKLCKAILLRNN